MDSGPARERMLEAQCAAWIDSAQALSRLAIELLKELRLHCDDPEHVEQLRELGVTIQENASDSTKP